MSVCQHEDCEREAVAQWNGCVFCDEHVRERLRTTADSKLLTRIAELEKQLGVGVQTEHRARVLLTKLEAHIRDAREMFHVLRNDKGRDDQGLDMKHINTWLQAVHKTLHSTPETERETDVGCPNCGAAGGINHCVCQKNADGGLTCPICGKRSCGCKP